MMSERMEQRRSENCEATISVLGAVCNTWPHVISRCFFERRVKSLSPLTVNICRRCGSCLCCCCRSPSINFVCCCCRFFPFFLFRPSVSCYRRCHLLVALQDFGHCRCCRRILLLFFRSLDIKIMSTDIELHSAVECITRTFSSPFFFFAFFVCF